MSDLQNQNNDIIPHHHEPNEWQRAFVFWLTEFKSKHTRDAYQRAWNDFGAYTDNMHPDHIEHEHIRAWKHHLGKQGLSDATIHQKMCAISSFFKFVNEQYQDLRRDNPCEHVKRPTVTPYGKATQLHEGHDIKLLDSIDRTTSIGKRDYAIIRLLLTTAVRVSVIGNSTIGDIQRQGELAILHYIKKGGKPGSKKLAPGAWKAVKQYLDDRGNDLYDTSPLFEHKGNPITIRRVQIIIRTRCDILFGEGHRITPHSLRHTAAMQAIPHVSILGVRDLLDHSNVRVTNIYLEHQLPGEVGSKIGRILDKRYD